MYVLVLFPQQIMSTWSWNIWKSMLYLFEEKLKSMKWEKLLHIIIKSILFQLTRTVRLPKILHVATSGIYRVSQKEKSIFWEVIVSVILIKQVHMYVLSIPKGFRDGAIGLYSSLNLEPNNVLPSRMHKTYVRNISYFPPYSTESVFF